MKIIGVGQDDKYICEVSWEEMFAIHGEPDYDHELDINPGDEVDLQRVINAARWIRNLDNDHINGVINGLRTVLIGMEKVKDTAGALNLFNKIKDEK